MLEFRAGPAKPQALQVALSTSCLVLNCTAILAAMLSQALRHALGWINSFNVQIIISGLTSNTMNECLSFTWKNSSFSTIEKSWSPKLYGVPVDDLCWTLVLTCWRIAQKEFTNENSFRSERVFHRALLSSGMCVLSSFDSCATTLLRYVLYTLATLLSSHQFTFLV